MVPHKHCALHACIAALDVGHLSGVESSWLQCLPHEHAPRLLSCMQDCLSFGKPLLIENIEEELDPVLDPVLERRYVKKGRGYTVALADKEVKLSTTSG